MKKLTLPLLALLAGCQANVDLSVGRPYPCDPAVAEGQCAAGWRCSPERVCFDPAAPGRARACTEDAHCNTGWRCAASGFCASQAEQYTLEFDAAPGTASVGAVLSPPVRVRVKDSAGALATTSSFDVTLALAVNPTGATLAGAGPVRTTGGVATFDAVSIDRAGTGFVLAASAPGASGASSSPFDVQTTSVSQLGFLVQPAGAVAGATMPSVTVALQDALGNTVTGQDRVITLSLMGGGTLQGTTSVTSSGGLAAFTTLSIERAGSYALVAQAAGIVDEVSQSFTVTAAAPAKLRFTATPGNAVAGAVLAPAPSLVLEDAFGNATSSTAMVSLSLGAAALGGTSTRAAVAGAVTFDDLRVDTAGTGYVLQASSPGLTGAASPAFDVTAGAPAALAFTSPPMGATQGALLAPVQVSLADALGNRVTASQATVTLALQGSDAGATLSGTTSVAAVSGLATFSDLSIDRHGTGFALVASAAGVAGATSAPLSIARLAVAGLTLGRAQVKADAGLSWTLSGAPTALELTLPDGGVLAVTGQAGQAVTPFPTAPVAASPRATYKLRAETTRLTGERSEPALAFTFGGAGAESLTAWAVDENGGAVAAGTFTGTSTWGPTGGMQLSVTSAGGSDVVIGRTDETGELLWLVRAGGTGSETLFSIALLRDGSVAVVGQYSGTAVFGPGEANQVTLTTAGAGAEAFIARYTAGGQLAWVRRLSSTNAGATSDARGVAALPDGALAVVGSFARQTTFGAGELNATTLCANGDCTNGGTDVFVARYELDGTLAWARRAGSNSGDTGSAVVTGPGGDVCITGSFGAAPATFGPGEPGQVVLPSSNGVDGFVACYAPTGTLRWARRLASGGLSTALLPEGLAMDPGGDVIAVGAFTGTATFGPGETNATSFMSLGGNDGFVAHLRAADGALDWAKRVGGASADGMSAVAALDDFSVVVGGRFQGAAQFDTRMLAASGTQNTFLARLSPQGAVLEVDRSASSTGDAETVSRLVAWPDGSVWAGGSFQRTATFGAGEQGARALTSAGAADGYLLQWAPTTWRLGGFSPTGLAWAVAGGGPATESGRQVAPLPGGRVVTAGTTSGGTVTIGGTTLASASNNDLLVFSFSPSGALEWALRSTGSGAEFPAGVTGHLDGSVTVVGTFNGTFTLGTTSLTSLGESDVFLARISAGGVVQWVKRAGGASIDEAFGAAAVTGGGLLVAGQFWGTATFGAGEPGVTALTSAGEADVFVALFGPDGTLRWARRAGGTADDQAQAVAAMPNGGAIVTGYFTGTAIFGAGTANQVSLTAPSNNDLFVARYGPTGSFDWAKRAGGSSSPTAGLAAAALPDGSSWVAARMSAGPVVFGPGEASATTFSPGAAALALARYRPDGTLEFARHYQGGGGYAWLTLTTLHDGSPVVGGSFVGTLANDLGSQTYLTSSGNLDGYALKLSTAGFPSGWRRQVGAMADDDVSGLCVASGQSLAMTGTFSDAVVLGAGEANSTSLSGAAKTFFAARYWDPTP